MKAWVMVGLLLVVASGCANWRSQWAEETAKGRKYQMVQFGDMNVEPRIAAVLQGGSVVWVNLTTIYVGTVVFPPETKDHFTCDEIRPNFYAIDQGIQSLPIRFDNEDVTLPCALEPGTYPYEIWLTSQQGEYDNPELTLKGVLVFE